MLWSGSSEGVGRWMPEFIMLRGEKKPPTLHYTTLHYTTLHFTIYIS